MKRCPKAADYGRVRKGVDERGKMWYIKGVMNIVMLISLKIIFFINISKECCYFGEI